MAKNENMKLTEAQVEILKKQIPTIVSNLLNLEEGQSIEYTIEMDKNTCNVSFWSMCDNSNYIVRDEALIGMRYAKIEGGIVEC